MIGLYNSDSRNLLAYRDLYYNDMKIVSRGKQYKVSFVEVEYGHDYVIIIDDLGDEFAMSSDISGNLNSYVLHVDGVFNENVDSSDYRVEYMISESS